MGRRKNRPDKYGLTLLNRRETELIRSIWSAPYDIRMVHVDSQEIAWIGQGYICDAGPTLRGLRTKGVLVACDSFGDANGIRKDHFLLGSMSDEQKRQIWPDYEGESDG